MHGNIQEFLQLLLCHPQDGSAVCGSVTGQQLGGKDRVPGEALRSHLGCCRAVLGESPDPAPEGMAAPKSKPSNKMVLQGERLIIIGSKECASLTKAKGFFITVQLQLGRQC